MYFVIDYRLLISNKCSYLVYFQLRDIVLRYCDFNVFVPFIFAHP